MKKNRAWKSLLFKVSHLDLEYQDRKELMDQHRIEFDQLVCKEVGPDFYKEKYGESSSKDLVKSEEESSIEENDSEVESSEDEESSSVSEEDEEVSEKEKEPEEKVPESINKLWKLIALKTHPDRNKNNEALTQVYIEASDCYKEKSYGKLLILALELGINIPEDPELIPFVKNNIDSLQQKISHIETLALWQWISADEEQKKLIVKLTAEILKNRNLQSS
jgi:hypothetical protein